MPGVAGHALIAQQVAPYYSRRSRGLDQTFNRLVAVLLEYGVDIDARDQVGDTALMDAIVGQRADLVQALLEFGADPTIRGVRGLPIDVAERHEDEKIRKLLQEAIENRTQGESYPTSEDDTP